MKAIQVFTPGAFPQHTYVERTGEGLETQLRDAVDTPGLLTSLVGPSKAGKTVLVEKVVGRDLLITVTGAGVRSSEDVWDRVLDWMGAPASDTASSTTGAAVAAGVSATGGASALGFARAEATAKGEVEISHAREKAETHERRGLQQVVKEIANSEYVVLVDDFHYMPRDVQVETAKALKEAVRLGIKICTASVIHRGDDVVRANPELRGRVRAVDLRYWAPDDLKKIAAAGFDLLNADIDPNLVRRFVLECAGSPQLMQSLCLNACFVYGLRERSPNRVAIRLDEEKLRSVLEQTSASADFRSLVDVLDAGPRTRGIERKIYEFKDGTKGDVYLCVLKAIAADPPRLSFGYDDLLERTARVSNGESPVGSSVTGTCLQMRRLAQDKFPLERAIDWDESKAILDIPDPYLLFYLRWSGRLSEIE